MRVIVEGRAPKEWTGSVVIEGGREDVQRQVSGATCEEVVMAIALITSLWIKDESRSTERGEAALGQPLTVDERQPRTVTPSITGAADAAPLGNRSPPADGSAATAGDAAADELGQNEGEGSPHGQLSQHLIGHVGYASSPAGLAGAAVRYELWASASASSWAFAATASYAYGRLDNDSLGTSALTLLLAEVDLCPPGFDFRRTLWLRACALGRAGGLRFAGPEESLDNARAQWRPWAAAGVGVHLGFPLSSVLSLRALGKLSANLVRDRFDTERVDTGSGVPLGVSRLYRPGFWALDLGAGVSYEF